MLDLFCLGTLSLAFVRKFSFIVNTFVLICRLCVVDVETTVYCLFLPTQNYLHGLPSILWSIALLSCPTDHFLISCNFVCTKGKRVVPNLTHAFSWFFFPFKGNQIFPRSLLFTYYQDSHKRMFNSSVMLWSVISVLSICMFCM